MNTANHSMTLVLGGAIAAAVVIAIASSRSNPPAVPALTPEPAAVTRQTEAAPESDTAPLSGEVLESIPVSEYTYLRLRTGAGEVWAAVPKATIAVGSHVSIAGAARMEGFKSSTLKRTFDVIYFGTLAGLPPSGPSGPNAPSPGFSPSDVPGLDDEQQPLPPGHPSIDAGVLASPGPEASLPDARVERASGANAHRIDELIRDHAKLVGRRVRVRGQVTKVTPDVQGRTFFHVRDGSSADPAADLVVTSRAQPKRGEVAVFEGTLRTDVDVGIGFKYPVLLEDASIVGE